jgi:hypothetical protein
MITLHLAIYDGDIEKLEFNSKVELLDFIKELKSFNCIWLLTNDGEKGELIVTENIETIMISIEYNLCFYNVLYLQEYQTYEDAYAVALDMRDGNPKCYN